MMASKSTKSETSRKKSKNEESQTTGNGKDPLRFFYDHLYGIKTTDFWKTPLLDRSKSTYFILPGPRVYYDMIKHFASIGLIKPTVRDFEKFWFELSDLHKERYVLASYMAAFNRWNAGEIDGYGNLNSAVEVVNGIWNEEFAQIPHVIRGFIMEKNKNKFRRDGALSLFQNAYSIDDRFGVLQLQLQQIKCSIAQRLNLKRHGWKPDPLQAALNPSLVAWIDILIQHIFSGFVNTYFVWVSFDMENLRRYAMELKRKGESVIEYLDGDSRLNDQIDFMRKLNLAAPRWSQNDRRMMLDAIDSNGQSCRGTYVQMLLNEVGVEKFKKLVFGKQHFCAHCRRSSYTGEDRMLACKRCDTEGVRPRAWYCDRECQKADWRRHKASKHPATVVVEKMAGKKKKRKPRNKK